MKCNFFSYESIEAVNRSDCDSRLSFSNPHYLGPDVQALLADKQRRRRQQQHLSQQPLPPAQQKQVQASLMRTSDSHQSFAAALNSPADSLFSDYQDFHTRLHQDFVELNNYPAEGTVSAKPNAATTTMSKPAAAAGATTGRARPNPR